MSAPKWVTVTVPAAELNPTAMTDIISEAVRLTREGIPESEWKTLSLVLDSVKVHKPDLLPVSQAYRFRVSEED